MLSIIWTIIYIKNKGSQENVIFVARNVKSKLSIFNILVSREGIKGPAS
jgi:hypothetical protein